MIGVIASVAVGLAAGYAGRDSIRAGLRKYLPRLFPAPGASANGITVAGGPAPDGAAIPMVQKTSTPAPVLEAPAKRLREPTAPVWVGLPVPNTPVTDTDVACCDECAHGRPCVK